MIEYKDRIGKEKACKGDSNEVVGGVMSVGAVKDAYVSVIGRDRDRCSDTYHPDSPPIRRGRKIRNPAFPESRIRVSKRAVLPLNSIIE